MLEYVVVVGREAGCIEGVVVIVRHMVEVLSCTLRSAGEVSPSELWWCRG